MNESIAISPATNASAGSAGLPAGHIDEGAPAHDPALYSPMGDAFGVETLDDIGPDEIEFYKKNGYLVVRRAFTPAEIADGIAGLLSLIMGGRPDFKDIWFEAAAKDILPTLTVEQRQDAVRKIASFVRYDARLHAMAQHAKLLSIIRRLCDDREPALFQDMALVKPPRLGREKPWHQDAAYFDFPLGTPIVGVWIALDAATVENGCMQFLPGRHRDGPILHFKRRDWQICDTEMMGQRSTAAPLEPGGLLLFDALLPHGTPANNSERRRRALQFHYAPRDAMKAPPEQRLAIFGSEGKNVSC